MNGIIKHYHNLTSEYGRHIAAEYDWHKSIETPITDLNYGRKPGEMYSRLDLGPISTCDNRVYDD